MISREVQAAASSRSGAWAVPCSPLWLRGNSRRLWLGLLLVLVLPLSAQGQGGSPEGSSRSTSPWQVLTVVASVDNFTQKVGRVHALWIDGPSLWAGTNAGLSRYDGRTWHTDPHPGSTIEPTVRCLAGGQGDGVWAGLLTGLSHYDGAAWGPLLTTDDGLPDNVVTALARDGVGGLWVGTLRGLAHFDGRTVDWTLTEVDGQRFDTLGSVTAVLPGPAGGAYAAVRRHLIHVSRQKEVRLYGAEAGLDAGGGIQAMAAAPGGRVWVGTGTDLYAFDGTAFERIPLIDDAGEVKTHPLSLAADGERGLWLGTPHGLWHVDGRRIVERFTVEEGLAADLVQVIARTDDGMLWLGTVDGQISRGNPAAWRVWPDAGRGFRAIQGSADRLWATSDAGLAAWDGTRWTLVHPGPARGLWLDGDTPLFGTTEGVQRWAGSAVLLGELGAIPTAIVGDGAGRLWVGTENGLSCLRGDLSPPADCSTGLPDRRVHALLHDPATGLVWVGTDYGLAWGSEAAAWHSVTWEGGFDVKTVRALERGPDGSIWAGTGAGLRRLPPGAEPGDPSAWELYESRHLAEAGLRSLAQGDSVSALWVNPTTGQLWAGTDAGLWGLDDGQTWESQDDDVWVSMAARDSGLTSDRVTALWGDGQRQLWIGTATDLVQHLSAARSPELAADSLLANDNALGPSLPWDQAEVVFDFRGTSRSSELLAYRYRLASDDADDPVGDRWRVLSPRQRITLTHGNRYELTVLAYDRDLNASTSVGQSFTVETTPLLARREIQVALALVALVGVGAAAVLGPGRRWWHAYQRQGYRETWTIDVHRTHPELPTFVLYARQRFSRDLRLIFEGRARHLLSPEGESCVTHSELPAELASLHAAWRAARTPEHQAATLDALARALGASLLDGLGPVRASLQRAAAGRGYYVRLRLNFREAPMLAAWPWEVAAPRGLEPLGANAATALSRWMPRPTEAVEGDRKTPPTVLPALARGHKLRILLVLASPMDVDLPPLDGNGEASRLKEALTGLPVTFTELIGPGAGGPETEFDTVEALARELEAGADVIHYIGHAGPHPRRPDRQVVLYGEDPDGDLYAFTAADLVEIVADLHRLGSGPRLLVLNACQTAEVHGEQALAGLVPTLIAETGLTAVVGMQYPVGEGAAVFSSTFYPALARGQTLDYAVARAREAMRREIEGRDWTAPVLYMQVADGMIYRP